MGVSVSSAKISWLVLILTRLRWSKNFICCSAFGSKMSQVAIINTGEMAEKITAQFVTFSLEKVLECNENGRSSIRQV